jgi:hypothetical protein
MRNLICAAALALAAGTAMAGEAVYKSGGLTVRLTQAECAVPIAMLVLPQLSSEAPKAASVSDGKVSLQACWVLDSDGDVALVDEAGNGGFLPGAAFKLSPGV